MAGFTQRTVDNYIRQRIKFWIYDLGRHAELYLKDDLGLSTNLRDDFTDEDREKIRAFQRQVVDDVIVTGGCFTSMLQGDEPNDIDIYFKTKDTAIKLSNFYIGRMRETGELHETSHIPQIAAKETEDGVAILIRSQGVTGEGIDSDQYKYFECYPDEAAEAFFKEYRKNIRKDDLEKKRFMVSFMTSNAITLNNGLQLIIRFTGDPEEIHSNFDFIHATNYWTWAEGVVYNVEALRATAEKRLYYFGSRFPVATIFRLRKFVERGWRISAGEMVKIMYDISKLNLDDPYVLKDQSVGMDSAYFCQVVRLLREGDQDIDRTYLFNIIDQVFNLVDKQDDFLAAKADDQGDIAKEEEEVFPTASSVDIPY